MSGCSPSEFKPFLSDTEMSRKRWVLFWTWDGKWGRRILPNGSWPPFVNLSRMYGRRRRRKNRKSFWFTIAQAELSARSTVSAPGAFCQIFLKKPAGGEFFGVLVVGTFQP